MFCGQCGKKIEGNVAFCPGCGARLGGGFVPPAPPAPPVQKKKFRFNKKAVTIGAVCLAVVVVLSVVATAFSAAPGFIPSRNEIGHYYDGAAGQSIVMIDGSSVGSGMEGRVSASAHSLDGSVGVFQTDSSCLYLAEPGKLTQLTEDADTCALSADGTAVAYVTNDETLTLYSVKDGQRAQIASEVVANSSSISGLCISPDGNSLLYTTRREPEEGPSGTSLYLYTGGKSTNLGDDLKPVGLANSGRFIYYYDTSKESLYTTSAKGDVKKLAAKVDIQNPVLFNSDLSEILLRADGKWYVSSKGGEKARISSFENRNLTPVLPQNMNWKSGCGNALSESGASEILCLRSLTQQYYSCGSDLFYMEKDWTTRRVGANVDSGACLSAKGDKLFYRAEDTLYARGGKDLAERTLLTRSLASSYYDPLPKWAVTPDGKAAYYIDADATLWYRKDSDAPKRIAEDASAVFVTHDGIALFLTDYGSDVGTLYSCKNGGKKTYIFEDCTAVVPYSTATMVITKEDANARTIYTADKGTDFKTVAEISN